MSWNWQDLVAMFIVGVAFAYIVSIVYRRMRRRGSGACGGGCFGCKQADPEPTQVIQTIGMSESVGQHDAVCHWLRQCISDRSTRRHWPNDDANRKD